MARRSRARPVRYLTRSSRLRHRIRLKPGGSAVIALATAVAGSRVRGPGTGRSVSRRPAPRRACSSWPGPTARSSIGTAIVRRRRPPVSAAGVARDFRRIGVAARPRGTRRQPSGARRLCGDSASPVTGRSSSPGFKTPTQLRLAQELIAAQTYLRAKGLDFDLVFLSEEPGGYEEPLRQAASGTGSMPTAAPDRTQPAGRCFRAQSGRDGG